MTNVATNPVDDAVLVGTAPIARVLRCSARQVERLAAAGEIPSIRVGRSLRFEPDAVAAAMAEGPAAERIADAFRSADSGGIGSLSSPAAPSGALPHGLRLRSPARSQSGDRPSGRATPTTDIDERTAL